jgi:uncharacterized alpha-E superfamily protein
MMSRVAESLFWMSRYIERAENTARFLDVNFQLLLDVRMRDGDDAHRYWASLIRATSDPAHFEARYAEYTGQNVTDYLVFDREHPNSITACLVRARENARSMIESISSEMWEQINRLHHFVQQATPLSVRLDPYHFYREIKSGSHLFQGIADSTFAHSEGWDFMQIGKYLERADNTARLVDVKYHALEVDQNADVDVIQWMAVLKSCSALEAFRKVYLAQIEPETILRFLLFDRAFPRSLYFAVVAGEEALWRISGSSRRNYVNQVDRLVGKLESEMAYTSVEDARQRGLRNYLLDVEAQLVRIGELIAQTYFTHAAPLMEPLELPLLVGQSRGIWSLAQQQQQQ